MKVVLASQSPRRKELLGRLVSTFEVQPADIDETPFEGENPKQYVQRMALEKAKVVKSKQLPDTLIIASDTTVVLEDEIMGKPENEEEAQEMLRKLSGTTHDVYTAVVLTDHQKEEKILAHAAVTFYDLTDVEIAAYLATGDYADKAGAYGIQSLAGAFVKAIDGDYYSIVGFPIGAVNQALKKFN
ncbi:Maf family protein [Enterococcus durans]|uniref:dTTP/UTP pyrophosphatase n=2 Tax=Enterococcus durans TaxID=53345 RepID=A0AB36SBU6_9ENTE|nr:Maf family protein [Enterococcus durans]HCB28542.1 septum formation inhibitor Maf [Enterococcus sp.]EOT33695.1 septum formation protein Maf [Enterococcus durans ATCC 6056]EOU25530.1 septum formation protein Maf [Enterococcus durans ATCC 6056]MBM1153203.1 septum formation inhibitor Maf [Enterococcus durans]MBT9717743.1 septum formation inhibitor Maf [Enterococcus durans]